MFERFKINWSELAQQDLMFALIALGIASLLAFLIGWILRNFAVKKWKNRFNTKSEEYDAKVEAYNILDTDFAEGKRLLEIRENDNLELNQRLERISAEFDSLNSQAVALKTEKETALQQLAAMPVPVVEEVEEIEEEELVIDTDGDGVPDKPMGWMGKFMGYVSGKNGVTPENEIETEPDNEALEAELELKDKYEAASKMVDRLISANEKLETENEEFKSKLSNLNTEVEEANAKVEAAKSNSEPASEVVVEKADVEKYTASLTEARVTGTKLLERIQELEVYNGRIIKDLEAAKTSCNNLESKVANTGDFEAKYKEILEKFEQAEIKNNSIAAELKLAQTQTVKADTTALDAKSKELDKCNENAKSLQAKLDTLKNEVEGLQKEKAALSSKVQDASADVAAKQKMADDAALKAKQAEEAKAKAEAKAKQEAEAKKAAEANAAKAEEDKKAAEAKAKQEAEAKKAAEEKAAKEAEAKKAAEAKAKQEAEARKAAEEKAAKEEAAKKAAVTVSKQQEIKLDSQDEVMQRIKAKAASIEFDRIGRGDATKRDDLKEIKGIGPFIEKKLNALGIYNFSQIANFNEGDGDKVNEAIEFFPGRVKRDNWMGQAKKLMK